MTKRESEMLNDVNKEVEEVKDVLLSCLEIDDRQAQHAAEEVVRYIFEGRIVDDEYQKIYHKHGGI